MAAALALAAVLIVLDFACAFAFAAAAALPVVRMFGPLGRKAGFLQVLQPVLQKRHLRHPSLAGNSTPSALGGSPIASSGFPKAPF